MALCQQDLICAMRRPLARVGMVYSQQTASFYGGEKAQAKVDDPALGFYQALIEARIPFEMVHDRLLDHEHIAQFRTLILPNIAALSTRNVSRSESLWKAAAASSPPTRHRFMTNGACAARTSDWHRSSVPPSAASEEGPC